MSALLVTKSLIQGSSAEMGINMIYFNQIGYLPHATKIAVLTHKADHFFLCDRKTGENVYEGIVQPFKKERDAASGDIVFHADFSDFCAEGEYFLRAGEILSAPFAISKTIYHQLKIDLLRSYYFQRCGCALTSAHAGKYIHGCCHSTPATLLDDPSVKLDLSGGWHDAGDYGRYVTAAATALAHLLYAFVLFPDRLLTPLDIPESGNGTPDLLNECRYELTWLLKMQRADGGVFHKVSTWHHAPFIMPEFDTAPLFAYAISTPATADFAAVMALASRVYAPLDKIFAEKLKNAALRSWDFLENHPEQSAFTNPPGSGTGEYGDFCDRDERFWAAAELFSLTGEEKFFDVLSSLFREEFSKTALGYASTGGFGALSFYLSPVFEKTDSENLRQQEMNSLRNEIRREFLAEANHCIVLNSKSAYPVAMAEKDYHWGSNMTVMNRGILLILGFLFTGDKKYREAALAQLDYLLGRNALGFCYVTGHGTHSCLHPHMRTIFADGIEEPIPGFVSGGPNMHPCDEVGKHQLPANTPPMKSYLDDYACYSLNEVTIYWNSPAVFVTAFFDGEEKE